MQKPRWRLFGEALLLVAVLVSASVVYSTGARRVDYFGDEGRFLFNGRYFNYLFVQRDVTRSEWGDDYWTHTQPMVARYVVGGWLWLRGYQEKQMPKPYDWAISFEKNQDDGRVPGAKLLAEARMPMVGLTVITTGLLYLLGRVLGGPVAGIVTAGLTLGNPLATPMLVRAWTEPPLAFFIVLSLLLAVLGARRGRDGGLPVGWAVGLGVALGLGLGTKLTAAMSIGAVIGWGALVTVSSAARPNPRSPRAALQHAWQTGRGWLLAAAIGLGVFVLSNPHLYPDPILHTGHLIQNRSREMLRQQRSFDDAALVNLQDRPGWVLSNSLVSQTWSGSNRVPLEAVLAAIGTGTLLVTCWRGWRQSGQIPAGGIVLVTALVYFSGISISLLLAWAKYLVPTILLGLVLSGLGAATLARWLITVGTAALAARRSSGLRRSSEQLSPSG